MAAQTVNITARLPIWAKPALWVMQVAAWCGYKPSDATLARFCDYVGHRVRLYVTYDDGRVSRIQ